MKPKEKLTAEKIVLAARTIFSEKGLAGARMRQIAETAGVNQALLHYHFGSKENLYNEVIYNAISDIYTYLSGHFQAAGTAEEGLARFVSALIDVLHEHPELPQLMLSELSQGAGHIRLAFARVFEEKGAAPPDFVIPLITASTNKGLIRPVDPMQTAISIMGMCLIYFIGKPVIQVIWDGPENEAQFLEDRKAAILDLVRHGLLCKTA